MQASPPEIYPSYESDIKIFGEYFIFTFITSKTYNCQYYFHSLLSFLATRLISTIFKNVKTTLSGYLLFNILGTLRALRHSLHRNKYINTTDFMQNVRKTSFIIIKSNVNHPLPSHYYSFTVYLR